ncbi:MAG: ATP synthase F1 subunit epsilon [Candidatus Cloacimonetes bacterium 4572_55]|nr:MAG: ATP synthase F1 subunit epsilon [Candidatus Cloacimonetes bacterium 4572_55]
MSMTKSFQMDIVTPDKTALSREVTSLVVPAAEGYLGVLANHAPMMAELMPGRIQIKEPNGKKAIIVVSGGFMEVKDNKVSILAESVDYIEEASVADFSGLDMRKAEEALKEAKKRLAEL